VGRALSLATRQLLAASLGLIAFLGLTGYALDRAFVATAQNALSERLENLTKDYIFGIELDRQRNLITPEVPPDLRFLRPGSGLYARARGQDLRWESASSLGRDLPPIDFLAPGKRQFDGPLPVVDVHGLTTQVYAFSMGVVWEPADNYPLTFTVYEDAAQIEAQVALFRRALWGYLGLAAALLLVVQAFVLRWSLRPLALLQRELERVRRGVATRLSGAHPRELEPVADSINQLLEGERGLLDRTRNTLADLAHSLKTPLAVLRSRLDADSGEAELRAEVQAQVQRMNEIVSYQLSRAARSGHALFSAPLEIAPRAEEIVAGLEKVYAGQGVLCEFEIDAGARFFGELGDLQELLGNLLENAFKWARRRVLLTVREQTAPGMRRAGLFIAVEDDGLGIPAEKVEHLLRRGVRGDERVQGHGIGLAIVSDIVAAYRGELEVGCSPELGGARFSLTIPPVP
jgi:two-component system sensor histidine kinase PhoQ